MNFEAETKQAPAPAPPVINPSSRYEVLKEKKQVKKEMGVDEEAIREQNEK